MSKKVRKSLAVPAAFVLMISFIAGNDAFTNVYAQEAGTETASEQITSTTEASSATEEAAAAAAESVTTEQKTVTESNTEKNSVKSVKQASEPAVTNGDFSKYLTKFAFTDHLGNAFTESHPVTKDSNVIIRYEFKIPNKETIQGGSDYILKMPNVFH